MAFQSTLPTILCCMCGIPIPSNPSNMCVNCIRSQVDITEGIPRQLTIQFCRECERYLQPPKYWLTAELESRELLTFCLKKIKGLNKVRLVDASFVWTEPHSRRIKVKLVIQKEVFNGAILQQQMVIEFVVAPMQCESCQQSATEHTWTACVQLRQKVEHKRTFLFLEQLILKHKAHDKCVNIKDQPDGIDFFFGHRSHALKFVDFLGSVVPLKSKSSEKLISQDDHNNTFNFKYSWSTEIAPICRDDIICLPPRLATALGGIGPLVLCWKINSNIQILDPLTLQSAEILGNMYWKSPFRALGSARQLTEYYVLDVEPTSHFHTSGRFALADVQIMRSEDVGKSDDVIITRTHLGHILKPGDTVLGYDLAGANFNDENLAAYRHMSLPDVILVRKEYPRKENRNRNWTLKQLNKEVEGGIKKVEEERGRRDMERFMQELEEDRDMRSQINLYKNAEAVETMTDGGEEDEAPKVGLEELLDSLALEEGPDAGGAAGDDDEEVEEGAEGDEEMS